MTAVGGGTVTANGDFNSKKTAVMYGAGNIGRGFIGQLLFESGYQTTFVDVDENVVAAINEKHAYPLCILTDDSRTDVMIENIEAINGNDAGKVAGAISRADLMATAVGANILPRVAAPIAAGLARRFERGAAPIDVLICENLKDAERILRSLILSHLPKAAHSWFFESVGLVETSIGRMVPIQTPEMKGGDPMRICVEAYASLPVDGAAFRAGIPDLRGIKAFSPFSFYVERKLYIHNMGHALTAYCGDYLGCEYIWQAIGRKEVRCLVRKAMVSSANALAKKYGMEDQPLYDHVDDLIARFGNRQLGDTVYRVGRDLRRKLAREDRLAGALRLCESENTGTEGILLGIALALRFSSSDLDMPPEKALTDICGIGEGEPSFSEILRLHGQALEGSLEFT
ncbi:MAG: mannitol dehydrogenase [Clostridiales bacterium]|nr:mannitol dehydrogenase [Clostridiales bacterium]